MENRSIKIVYVGDDPDILLRLRALIKEGFPLAEVFAADNVVPTANIIKKNEREGFPVKNITDIKRSEENLKQEKVFQDAIFDSIPGFLYVYDEDDRLIKWNKNHEAMTGYSAEELAAMSLSDWYKGEDYVRVAAAAAEVYRTGYGEVEADLLIKGGKKIRVRSNGVRFTVGGKTYFTGVGTDITEQEKIAAELIEAKEYFEIVFNTSPDAALVTRLSDGVIVNINDGFTRLSGFSKDA